ncbi:MAG: pilus assembly protein, partial [Saezia sp.]
IAFIATPPSSGKVWCSAAEERYNFGMWHKYYRYRILAAKGAMSNVFASKYPAPIRVGYKALNNGVRTDVSNFEDANKSNFFTWLFNNLARGGTPLQSNVTAIGTYFKTKQPWEDSSGQEISCRQSILLIMSDGESGDGQVAPTVESLWNTDLRPNLADNVPMVGQDTKQSQHLRTFVVGFGSSGQADQMASAANGKGEYFQANSVSELVADLQRVFVEITTAANSLGAYPVVQDKYISATGNKVYTPIYTTGDWTGDLRGSGVKTNGSEGARLWSAAEQLAAVSAASRKIYINIEGQLVAFNSAIASYYGDSGTLGKYGLNSNVINYLRGNEISGFRERKSKLGDIINSRPVYVKEVPNLGYQGSFAGYKDYRTQMKQRAGRVLIGANDGMLHAFDTETGKEVFAFIPTEVIPKLSALADIDYKTDHLYYVDGPLVATDVLEGATWKNLVIGSLGAGGKSVFALDVTDADNYKLKWEILSKDHADLGFVMQPIQTGYIEVEGVGGAVDKKFVGFFGNGPYSANKNAVLFMVDLETGDVSQVVLDQTVGANGLMGVTLIKNRQGRVTGLYAGDLKGKLHSVEFKSTGSVSDISGSGPKPALDKFVLYTDLAGRPVTAAPVYENHPLGGKMVYFGTGKFFDAEDMGAVTIVDRVYGIRDKGAPADSNTIATRGFVYNTTTKSWVNQDSINYNSNINDGWTIKLDLPWEGNTKIEAMRS